MLINISPVAFLRSTSLARCIISVTNLFFENQVQAKFLSSTRNAFLWDNFQIYQVQKFENQVFNTNLSSKPSNSYQNQVQYLKIKCSWSHYVSCVLQYNVQYSVQVKSGVKMRQDLFGCLILLWNFISIKIWKNKT